MSEAELKLEIAIVFYKREKISAGKASEWLGMNLIEFCRELGKRELTINYDVQDFQADVETLRSLGRLLRLSVILHRLRIWQALENSIYFTNSIAPSPFLKLSTMKWLGLAGVYREHWKSKPFPGLWLNQSLT